MVEARGCAFNINIMRLDPNYQVCGQCLANSKHDEPPAPVSLMSHKGGTQSPLLCLVLRLVETRTEAVLLININKMRRGSNYQVCGQSLAIALREQFTELIVP